MKKLLNIYIDATLNSVRWLFYTTVSFIYPVANVVFLVMIIAGACSFILGSLGLLAGANDDVGIVRFWFYGGLFSGLAGMFLYRYFDMVMVSFETKLFWEFLDEEEDSAWLRLLQKSLKIGFLLMLWAGFSTAYFYSHHVQSLAKSPAGLPEIVVLGFVWFLLTGLILGAIRGFFRRYLNSAAQTSTMQPGLKTWLAMTRDLKTNDTASDPGQKNVVVPFRTKN